MLCSVTHIRDMSCVSAFHIILKFGNAENEAERSHSDSYFCLEAIEAITGLETAVNGKAIRPLQLGIERTVTSNREEKR
jgi:hypothetical protein